MSDTLIQLQDHVLKASKLLSNIRESKRVSDESFHNQFKDIEETTLELEATFNSYVNIESVVGARTPKWYIVDIDFVAGETQSKSRAFEISSEGAFVISSMQAFYKNEDTTPSNYVGGEDFVATATSYTLPIGRYLPTTTFDIFTEGVFKNLPYSAGTTPSVNEPPQFGNEFYEFPEFSFLFEVETASQKWTNRPIPASAIFTIENPLQFSSTCYLERSERLIVTARPDARVPLTGKVRLVMHGYQILGPVNPKLIRRLR